jgi:murein DD-endopeptidase MepM/ murein hydrolase activator NlpD
LEQNHLLRQDSAYIFLAPKDVELGAFPVKVPTLKWGLAIDTFEVVEKIIAPNEVLGSVLSLANLDATSVDQLLSSARGTFDVKNWRVGKPYFLLRDHKTCVPEYIVYEPSIFEYFVFDLQKGICQNVKRPVSTELAVSKGTIDGSLWQAMVDNGMSYELADKMEDALQWNVDFHHTQSGDVFKLLYDQKFVEGAAAGVGKLFAASYHTGKSEFFAIYFDSKTQPGYYDLEGRPVNKGFLKAPVKYARISSGFSMSRFHPILKYSRPHLGTDYAAPYGTPILAVGGGVVVEATRAGGNGNYVKIKHDNTYQTQYLHMQKFAPGIRPGAHVQQGQVIGYVGATGLATGPHVCFRFWKNGNQVNHRNLNFPPPNPLPAAEMPAFTLLRDKFLAEFKALDASDHLAKNRNWGSIPSQP